MIYSIKTKNMKKIIKKLFQWIFEKELSELQKEREKCKEVYIEVEQQRQHLLKDVYSINILRENMRKAFKNIDISVDVHRYSKSWAVISIQGETTDFIKFIDLGKNDIREIQKFLSMFDHAKVDTTPNETTFIKFENPFKYKKF
jgi:hypothetical protein